MVFPKSPIKLKSTLANHVIASTSSVNQNIAVGALFDFSISDICCYFLLSEFWVSCGVQRLKDSKFLACLIVLAGLRIYIKFLIVNWKWKNIHHKGCNSSWGTNSKQSCECHHLTHKMLNSLRTCSEKWSKQPQLWLKIFQGVFRRALESLSLLLPESGRF